MLSLTNMQIVYDRVIEAVRDVSLEVPEGRLVALLGSNGAGKSTLLKAISNVLFPEKGEVLHGQIMFRGRDIAKTSANEIVRAGIIHVPEGRRLFPLMTVEENLLMGGYTSSTAALHDALDRVYTMFPRLKERRKGEAGYLSGGEQQMVAVGRALIGQPKLLLLDEPSLGLAPQIIEEIFEAITRLRNEEGISILLVEQNAALALEIADYAYIMENGRIVLDGTASEIGKNADVKEFYLGFGDHGAKKSFRDIKHYKRRKRWLS
tara:strand:+ start:25273 stop:26064 length:792 start_codon:yes stop_codon:yes gene_type:complete